MTSLKYTHRHEKAGKRKSSATTTSVGSTCAQKGNEATTLTESIFLDLGFAQIVLTWFWWWFGELISILQNDAHPLAEAFAWFFSFSITTFSVIPVAICLIECGLGLRVVPESVSGTVSFYYDIFFLYMFVAQWFDNVYTTRMCWYRGVCDSAKIPVCITNVWKIWFPISVADLWSASEN